MEYEAPVQASPEFTAWLESLTEEDLLLLESAVEPFGREMVLLERNGADFLGVYDNPERVAKLESMGWTRSPKV